MLYLSLNWLLSLVEVPVRSFRSMGAGGGSSPKQHSMTVPTLSSPRLPALPAICVYSPDSSIRN